jgi:hypothetical protein
MFINNILWILASKLCRYIIYYNQVIPFNLIICNSYSANSGSIWGNSWSMRCVVAITQSFEPPSCFLYKQNMSWHSASREAPRAFQRGGGKGGNLPRAHSLRGPPTFFDKNNSMRKNFLNQNFTYIDLKKRVWPMRVWPMRVWPPPARQHFWEK